MAKLIEIHECSECPHAYYEGKVLKCNKLGGRTVPGFWPAYYMCKKDNIVETINRMLREHAPDFPNTACGGFEIEEQGEFIVVRPIVMFMGGLGRITD